MRTPVFLTVLLFTGSLLGGCSTIGKILETTPPTIETFEATLEGGGAPAEVLFSWTVQDPDSATLSCVLDFGDGVKESVDNCSQVTNMFHTFTEPGNYVVQLSVSDGRDTRSGTVPVVIGEGGESGDAPESLIIQFVAQPETGNAPLLSVFRWTLDTDEAVTCTLDFDDGETETLDDCQEVTDTFHEFEDPGAYRVVLSAETEEMTSRKSLIIVVNEPPDSPQDP